jgi:hypothetical protein
VEVELFYEGRRDRWTDGKRDKGNYRFGNCVKTPKNGTVSYIPPYMEKKYRGVEGWLHSFSALAVVTDGWRLSHLEYSTPEKNAVGTIG